MLNYQRVPFPSIFCSWNFYPTPAGGRSSHGGALICRSDSLSRASWAINRRSASARLRTFWVFMASWGGRGGHLFSDGDFTDFSGDFQAPQLAGKLRYCIHCLNPYFNRIYNAMAGQHPNSQHPQNICWSISECRENVHPWPPPSLPHPNTPILLDSRSFSQYIWSPPTPKKPSPQ